MKGLEALVKEATDALGVARDSGAPTGLYAALELTDWTYASNASVSLTNALTQFENW